MEWVVEGKGREWERRGGGGVNRGHRAFSVSQSARAEQVVAVY